MDNRGKDKQNKATRYYYENSEHRHHLLGAKSVGLCNLHIL